MIKKIFCVVIVFLSNIVFSNANDNVDISFSVRDLQGREFYNEKSFNGKVAFVTHFLVDCHHCISQIANYGNFENNQDIIFAMISLSGHDKTINSNHLQEKKNLIFLEPNDGVDSFAFTQRFGNDEGLVPYTVVLKKDSTLCKIYKGVIDKDKIKTIYKECSL